MSWLEERDRLIAETMAFVKEVSGEEPQLAVTLQPSPASEIDAAPAPRQILHKQSVPVSSLKLSDMREDMRSRVASFKAQQLALQNEREAYFRQTLDRARAALRS